ncbi:MAG: putative ribosome biogenesis GTPase RsgA [Firmicutes bacterium ADurb.Bin193]|nr:MAG: putative ribosome biogenesis GTPase RsgA [Firmicutes bacterium ADurb.Bin193]
MNKTDMQKLGLSHRLLAEASLYSDFFVGRVISQNKDLYNVVCESGVVTSEVSGKFRFEAKALSDYPAVGDFVMLDRDDDTNGNAIIHNVLTRKSSFIRKAAGTANDEQVVAANIDTVFICMSLNNDFNLRRLERYLSIAWDSRATPVVVLTKADLCDDLAKKLLEVNSVAVGVETLVTTSMSKDGYNQVLDYIKEGKTVAFIGSSGVGKSTLINRLLGDDIIATKEIRSDDRGRHTTTKRELFILPNGGMVIDTPGMRELGLESADLQKAFSDIDKLSALCRFNDCAHKSEPGCAVLKAVNDGTLTQARLESYQKLKKEAKYEGLNSKQIETAKINEMFKSVGGIKNARRLAKEKNKRR